MEIKRFFAILSAFVPCIAILAESYTIEFAKSTTSGTKVSKTDFVETFVSSGAENISAVSSASYCYTAVGAIQLGYGHDGGNFSIQLDKEAQVTPTSIEIVAQQYKNDAGSMKVQYSLDGTINSVSPGLGSMDLSTEQSTLVYEVLEGSGMGIIKALRISSTARAYIKSIKVNYSEHGGLESADAVQPRLMIGSVPEGLMLQCHGEPTVVSIYDVSGRLSARLAVQESAVTVPLPKGFYVVTVTGEKSQVAVVR